MHDYSQWRQEWQWGKAQECYQRGIDVGNLAEEFYQSLMSGYRIIEALGYSHLAPAHIQSALTILDAAPPGANLTIT
jgi:hypothetical protein